MQRNLKAFSEEEFDLVVVGGGIIGQIWHATEEEGALSQRFRKKRVNKS